MKILTLVAYVHSSEFCDFFDQSEPNLPWSDKVQAMIDDGSLNAKVQSTIELFDSGISGITSQAVQVFAGVMVTAADMGMLGFLRNGGMSVSGDCAQSLAVIDQDALSAVKRYQHSVATLPVHEEFNDFRLLLYRVMVWNEESDAEDLTISRLANGDAWNMNPEALSREVTELDIYLIGDGVVEYQAFEDGWMSEGVLDDPDDPDWCFSSEGIEVRLDSLMNLGGRLDA